MNSLKRSLTRKYGDREDVIGVIMHENPYSNDALTCGFRYQVMVVSNRPPVRNTSYHYIKEGTRLQERWVAYGELDPINYGKINEQFISFIIQGEMIMDRDKHMENLRRELMELPRTKKAQLLLVEFSRFLSRFFRSKEHFVNDHLLDAYSSVEEAMSHWARIVVIEHGGDIHGQIWEQVKRYNAGVHKLYEELILSEETLSQRVELVMLACEFSIVTQMESCCSILLELLNSRHQPWSAAEIRQHPSIAGLDVDISLLLGVLAKKTLIREVLIGGEMGDPIQIKYTC